MGIEATQTHGMHMNAVNHLATGATICFGGIRNRAKTCGLTSCGNTLRGMECGAGRSIHLVRVVQFDHFGGFEVRSRNLGEIVGKHGGNGEVRRNEHALALARRGSERGTHLIELLIGPTGGAHHHVNTLRHECEHIVKRHARHGELHHHVSIFGGNLAQVVASVKRERQFGVVRVVHSVDHVGTHAPFGTNYRNLDHCNSFKRSGCIYLQQLSTIPTNPTIEYNCPNIILTIIFGQFLECLIHIVSTNHRSSMNAAKHFDARSPSRAGRTGSRRTRKSTAASSSRRVWRDPV